VITITKEKEAAIRYLERDSFTNLNILNYLKSIRNGDVYLYNDNVENGVIAGSDEQDFFYLSTYDPAFIKDFWELLSPGHKCFSGVPGPIADILREGKDTAWQNACKVYALRGTPERANDAGYSVGSLSVEDAEEVDRYYTYRSDDSLDYLREAITLCDSACIRIGGELASWCAVHVDDSSMGPLFTKEQYRGMGLAKIVASRLIEKLVGKNIIPYVQIVEDNRESLSVVRKLKGMEYSHDCVWFGIVK